MAKCFLWNIAKFVFYTVVALFCCPLLGKYQVGCTWNIVSVRAHFILETTVSKGGLSFWRVGRGKQIVTAESPCRKTLLCQRIICTPTHHPWCRIVPSPRKRPCVFASFSSCVLSVGFGNCHGLERVDVLRPACLPSALSSPGCECRK